MIAALTPADRTLTNFDYVRAPTANVQGPRGLPVTRPPWSRITATDMNRGEHRWMKAIGGAPDSVRNHPALQGLGLDFASMGKPLIRPSPLVTKTLLFLGESGALSGDPGGSLFRAYDKLTGQVVAEIDLPAKSTGAPMTYLHRGKQYIVVAVATRDFPAELVALSLPVTGGGAPSALVRAPAAPSPAAAVQSPAASVADLSTGRQVYARSCAACHGAQGSGVEGAGPALTGQSDIAKLVQKISLGGAEMPPMQTILTAAQIRDVSQFVAAGLPP